jgi:cysteine dioxygenase
VTQAPLDALCTELQAEFRRDPRGAGVAALLARYSAAERDWAGYARFSETCYTRNLVHRCGDYELLILCWERGQVSPIHNHSGQSCWMAVLEGALEEVHYRVDVAGAALREGERRSFEPGQVAYIVDDIALHRIRPVTGGRGVSLHLYSAPIDDCLVYCPDTGRTESVALGYHSVRGELCGDGNADDVRAQFA